MRRLPALEDLDDESVFMVSCMESEIIKRHRLPVGDIEIEGIKMLALFDTGPP